MAALGIDCRRACSRSSSRNDRCARRSTAASARSACHAAIRCASSTGSATTPRYRSGRATLVDRCDDAEIEVTIEPVAADDVDRPLRRVADPAPRASSSSGRSTSRRSIRSSWLSDGGATIGTIDRLHTVTVHPKVYELLGPEGSSRVVENESIVRRAATDPLSGFVSMREYVDGDDPRLIHWPTTARIGTLMVREHVEVAAARVHDRRRRQRGGRLRCRLRGSRRRGRDVGDPCSSNRARRRRPDDEPDARRPSFSTRVRSRGARPADAGRAGRERCHARRDLFVNGFDHTSVLMITGPEGPTTRVSANDQMLTIRVGEGARSAERYRGRCEGRTRLRPSMARLELTA